MAAPNPTDTPSLYDVLVLAGRSSPGVVELSEFGRETGWDEQAAKGQDGATTVKNGSKLVSFTATWTLFKDELRDEFAAWETWSRVLDTPVKPHGNSIDDPGNAAIQTQLAQQLAELKQTSALIVDTGNMSSVLAEDPRAVALKNAAYAKLKPPKVSALDAYHPMLAELGVRSVVVKKRGALRPNKGNMSGSGTVSVDFLEFRPPKPSPATSVGSSKDTTDPVDPRVAGQQAILQQRQDTLKALNQGHQTP